MSVSGSTNYTETRDNIITDALLLLGAIGENETPSTAAITNASRMLNNMIKSWQSMGLNLWTSTEGTIFLKSGISTYKLNASTGDLAASSNTIETRLTSAVSSGNTTLVVASTLGMNINDIIVVGLSDGTLFSSTISSITNTTTLVINTPLSGNAAGGTIVATYATQMDRPLDILSIRFRNSSGFDKRLWAMTKDIYFALPNKTTSSTPNSFYYDPQLGTGILHIWPCPSDSTGSLEVSYTRLVDDFDSSNDNPDFPTEWNLALTYGLASYLAPMYGRIDYAQANIDPKAQGLLNDLMEWDNERDSMSISHDESTEY